MTGTAEELDRDLPSTIVSFVSAHLQLKNTLDRAQADMDAAVKAATAEANAKKKAVTGKKEPAKLEAPAKNDAVAKPATPTKPEPPKLFGLFDEPVAQAAAPAADPEDEENEILAEAGRVQEDEEDEELDEAA